MMLATVDAPVAARCGGRPPLVVGGKCARGHILGKGDIVRAGLAHTCRLCRIERWQARKNGQALPYHCTTHFRCGHEKTPENTNTQGQCRVCENVRKTNSYHASESYQTNQRRRAERRKLIFDNWLAGETQSDIAKRHGISHERVRQIVRMCRGVTVRMHIDTLGQLLAGSFCVVRNNG